MSEELEGLLVAPVSSPEEELDGPIAMRGPSIVELESLIAERDGPRLARLAHAPRAPGEPDPAADERAAAQTEVR